MRSVHDEFREGWRVVLAACIGVGCGLTAFPFYTIGVFAAPLAEEFGWSRGEIFLAVGFMLVSTLPAAPVIGYLSDRFGVRRIALISIVLFASSFAAISMAQKSVWTFHAIWLAMALVSTGTTPITWTRAINGWFDKGRGLALGLTLAGTGVAATILPFYAAKLIDTLGWRGAYIGLGATILVVALPAVFLFFRERGEITSSKTGEPTVETGLTVGQALHDYRFWVMGVALVLISLGVSGLISNLIPLLTDKGYTLERAAGMAGIIGFSVVIGRIFAGLLMDRFWAPGVAFCFLVLPAVSCFILLGGGGALLLTVAAIIFIGLAAGAEFDVIAYLVSRYFGMKNYSKIYSGQYVFFAAASGLGPGLFGASFDRAGNYDQILMVSVGFFVIGAGLFLLLGRYPSGVETPALQTS